MPHSACFATVFVTQDNLTSLNEWFRGVAGYHVSLTITCSLKVSGSNPGEIIFAAIFLFYVQPLRVKGMLAKADWIVCQKPGLLVAFDLILFSSVRHLNDLGCGVT